MPIERAQQEVSAMRKELTRLIATAFLGLLVSACGGGGGSHNHRANAPPVASFTATPASGTAPLTVQFDASASTDTGGSIASYSWSFGDSSAAGSSVQVSHAYQSPGTFTVTLTVTDNQGAIGTATRQVTVTAMNPKVPNVVGTTEAAARSMITAATLNVGTVSQSGSDTVAKGNVISQYPSAGLSVSPGTAVSLLVSKGGSGTQPILVILVNPTLGSFVADQTAIEVKIASTYEVNSVTASMAGRETRLTAVAGACSPGSSCSFVGTLALAGVPAGPHLFTVRADDTRGNVDQVTVTVLHDNPPSLTVVAPLNDSVALPTVSVDAHCTDDLPGCVVEGLVVPEGCFMDCPYQIIDSAPGVLQRTVDLTRWIGTVVELDLHARDAADQRTDVSRTRVFVESPARLRVLAEAPGTIVDTDGARLLFVEATTAGDRIGIYTRATAATEEIPLPSGLELHGSAYLTPTGAIFVTQARGGTVLSSHLYLWLQGSLTDLGYPESEASLAVSGSYAIWNQSSNLYRINTTTGVSAPVASDTGNYANSVAPDGTVVFWTTTYQIIKDNAGQQTALTTDPSQWHTYPLTDGNTVVYRQHDPAPPGGNYAIAMTTGGGPLLLTARRSREPTPGLDYQVAAGWVAYTDLGNLQQLLVFARSPQGVITRHTDLSSDSRIDRLADNGEVMVINGDQRFFSRGSGMVAVSSREGRAYWFSGAWYVAIGRVLLAVDTRTQ
jgi:PKD repeat protein